MQQNDIVIINVTGTNGTTRHQKTISRKFNGTGAELNEDGQVIAGSQHVLRNLPNGATTKGPDFPTAAFLAAQAKGLAGVDEMKAIQVAYAEQFAAWEKSLGGGSDKLQIAKAALEYTKEFHNFSEVDDSEKFVMKLENLDVTQTTLNDGRSLFTVSGTAVFGFTA